MNIKKIIKAFVFSLLVLDTKAVFTQSTLNSISASKKEFKQASEKLPKDINFWSNFENEILAKAIVYRMSDEELFSQILMFGWAGAEPENLLYQWVERGLGSVKVFGWNTDDIKLVAKSITSLQKRASVGAYKIPLFVATDQEGGWIRHVKGATANTPGNMAIGASGYPSDAWYSAYYISREIKALGINMNFAPSVDLFSNHDSTIIGTRSFGEDPYKSGILGAAFSSGSTAAGVIPTAKHFPGHGDTDSDSHISLPEIDIDYKTFENRELVPFKHLIQENIPAIMSGHLSFPKIDKTGAPASLSKYFLTDLLRNKLNFKGLIITDDMMMNGDTIYAGSLSNAFRMAITAGNDIIISSTTAKLNESLWTTNIALMSEDEEFRMRVEDAAYRVIKAKLDYFKSDNAAPLYPDSQTISNFIPDKEGNKFFLEQACRSITVFKQKNLPINSENSEKILLAGALPKFFSEGKKRYPESGEFRFSYELGPNETAWKKENIIKSIEPYDIVIFCISNSRSAAIAKELKNSQKRVVIFSIMNPTHALDFDWAEEVLIGYSYSSFTFDAMFGALHGEYNAEGSLPFPLSTE